jgi:hypothetical protein
MTSACWEGGKKHLAADELRGQVSREGQLSSFRRALSWPRGYSSVQPCSFQAESLSIRYLSQTQAPDQAAE